MKSINVEYHGDSGITVVENFKSISWKWESYFWRKKMRVEM